MKITMYELLGLLKDGEAPKKIKIDDIIYELDEKTNKYFTKMENYRVALGGLGEETNLIFDAFENKVEILEEEKKIPEEIECYHQYDECVVKDKFYQEQKGSLVDEIIIDKINEIIDCLKSKGEK